MTDIRLPFGFNIKKRKYLTGILVWGLVTYFTILTINHFYGKHTLMIIFLVSGIGWFITFMWILLSSNDIKTERGKPKPKFDNPIHEALYDALKDMGKKKENETNER